MNQIKHESGLVWWPGEGMGYYPVQAGATPYDEAYWKKYLGYAASPMGRELNRVRFDLVRRWIEPDEPLVDIGIGCGQFVTSRNGTRGYDVNPVAVEWLKARDLWLDPYAAASVQNITCFDSLEHIAKPEELLAKVRSTVVVSIPVFKNMDDCLRSKHFRKDEHFWYWTAWGFVLWMNQRGFRLLHENRMEVAVGRESIGSFVFRRR